MTDSAAFEAGPLPARANAEPSLATIALIFWAAFALTVVGTFILDPALYDRQDPDSFLRIVQVRDLLAGQGWFDLVQHRMDPGSGLPMQWSRMTDAPLAALAWLGARLGLGEQLATTAWPLLLLLGLLGATGSIGHALGTPRGAGRRAAVWSMVLTLVFLDPMLLYMPGNVDHHNAQVAVTLAMVAFALRIDAGPAFGILAALAGAASLAIGLEMLPHVAVIAGALALRWAITGRSATATAAFGATLALVPGALYLMTGSPLEEWACDSLSFAFVIPISICAAGLAALTLLPASASTRAIRLLGLATLGAVAVAVAATITPDCLAGPYGQLAPELKARFLDGVTEAQPFPRFFKGEPVAAFASAGPLLVALGVALFNLRRWRNAGAGERASAWLWALPAVLSGLGLVLSFYQIRTLPFASAVAIPILGLFVAEQTLRTFPTRRARIVAVGLALLAAQPVGWLLVGLIGAEAANAVSGGRFPVTGGDTPAGDLMDGTSGAQRDCFDPLSAALLNAVPRGLVVGSVFYGSTVLKLSGHDVVAGPYHRHGQAILESIHATEDPPEAARKIFDARGVDYLAICAPSKGTGLMQKEAPDGLAARLLAGETPDWLEPMPGNGSGLRMWRVVR